MTTRLLVAVVFVLVGLAGMIGPASPAQAATLDVCPSGCSYTSIQAAIDAAVSGDTIAIGAGTYAEHLTIAKDLILAGDGEGSTILDGSNSGTVVSVASAVTVTISGVTIQHGISLDDGGGILNQGTLTVTTSTISDNTAEDGGGGIRNIGTLSVTTSTFSGNTAEYGGGIGNRGTLSVTTSTFSGNSGYTGGGIYNGFASTSTVTNSTFTGNSAFSGGGIYNSSGTLSVTHSTVSGNSATFGGGIQNFGSATLTNSIVVNSSSGGNCGNGSIADGGGNLNWPDTTCPGLNQDPLLGPLQDNGGPTLTHLPQDGSPAIDRIASGQGGCGTTLTTDQRGVARRQGVACDSGAVEVEVDDNSPPVTTPTVSGTLGDNGWYTSDVTVTWTVADAEAQITASDGCDTTTIPTDTSGTVLTCTATSGGGASSQSVTIKRDATVPSLAPTVTPNPVAVNQPATASANATDATAGIASQGCDPVDTTTVGEHTVTCSATDLAGNTASAEANYTVSDPTAPIISPEVSGTLGDNGWYTSNVTVAWTVTDAESAITGTNGCDPTIVTTDTSGTVLTCSATSAGGTSSQPVTVLRDATAPVVTFSGNQATYGLTDTVAIGCAASDATSGIASDTCQDVSALAASFDSGEYVITAVATDLAGNTGSAEARFVVTASHDGLCALTKELASNRATERAACTLLTAAKRAEQRGQAHAEAGMLAGYRVTIAVAIQLGHVSAGDGQTLIDWSRTL